MPLDTVEKPGSSLQGMNKEPDLSFCFLMRGELQTGKGILGLITKKKLSLYARCLKDFGVFVELEDPGKLISGTVPLVSG